MLDVRINSFVKNEIENVILNIIKVFISFQEFSRPFHEIDEIKEFP